MLKKIRNQATKDYLVHPLLSGPSFLPTLAANFTANVVRNLWSHSVIMCGHFPEGVETFERTSIEGETRGEWYVRQMLGSANISGSKADAPHDRQPVPPDRAPPVPRPAVQPLREIAPQVEDIFDRYGLTYHSRPLPQQVYSAWHKVVRLSLPNGFMDTTTKRNLPLQLGKLYKMVTGTPRERRLIQASLTRDARARRVQLAA